MWESLAWLQRFTKIRVLLKLTIDYFFYSIILLDYYRLIKFFPRLPLLLSTFPFWFQNLHIVTLHSSFGNISFNLTPKGIMLGNAMFESNLPVPNCILIFKYYLYICKLKDMLPNLNAVLQYLNSEIKMEKYSARLLSPSVVGDCFNIKWQPLEVALANVHG